MSDLRTSSGVTITPDEEHGGETALVETQRPASWQFRTMFKFRLGAPRGRHIAAQQRIYARKVV
jgi:hypothetical protein